MKQCSLADPVECHRDINKPATGVRKEWVKLRRHGLERFRRVQRVPGAQTLPTKVLLPCAPDCAALPPLK